MNRHLTSTSLVAFVAFSLFTAPAFAQHRGSQGHGSSGGHPSGSVHSQSGSVQRAQAPRFAAPRAIAPQVIAPRSIGPRVVTPNAVVTSRGYAVSRGYARPGYGYGGNGYRYGYGYAQPRVVTVHPFYNSYYSFRPRFSVGFGLWVGYPVAYPYYYSSYGYPVPYPAPYPSEAYPPQGAIAPTATGGLSFNITPIEAGIYIDGQYVGTASQFTPNDQPLPLSPGRHHVELSQPGYQTIAFDVDIIAGQVIPYQGQMQAQ